MGWAVGWDSDHHRFRGYGVPAYCDAKGCDVEIDRGLGALCGHVDYDDDNDVEVGGCGLLDDLERPRVFVCSEHTCADVDENALPREHPTWVAHLLTDSSWQQWRTDNPVTVAALTRPAEVTP